MINAFRSDEILLCQIPAIELLVNMGYHYLTPEQLLQARGNRPDNVLLEEVLRQQLTQMNQIAHHGQSIPVSEANISSALTKLKGIKGEGFHATNAALANLLTVGVNLEQTLDGDTKHFSLRYIDWEFHEKNIFHVAANYTLEHWHSHDPLSIDLMLFVNGIPFVVIECVAPQCSLQQAQTRLTNYHNNNKQPNLFVFAQMMLALNGQDACYAAVGNRTPQWMRWHEAIPYEQLQDIRNQPLPITLKAALFDLAQQHIGNHLTTRQERPPYHIQYEMNHQDQTLYAMCRPTRLLELVQHATLFIGEVRILARYYQYFAAQRALEQVRQWQDNGQRRGGVIVQTEGSGKSFTMLFFAKQLALAPDLPHPKIVIISQRREFGMQLGHSFSASKVQPTWVKTGHQLLSLIASGTAQLIFSKQVSFPPAAGPKKFRDNSSDIFLLIDEDHNEPLGSYAAIMRKMFPNACYIGFSGTPLTSCEHMFPLIDMYSNQQAQQDGLLLPLYYEARILVPASRKLNEDQNYPIVGEAGGQVCEQTGGQAYEQFNTWFERHTGQPDNNDQERCLQTWQESRKLPMAEQSIYDIAIDVSTHYRNRYQGSGLKGQLVAPDHHSALRYKVILDHLGFLDSALFFSSQPKLIKGKAKEGIPPLIGEEANQLLQTLWHNMIKPYGSEDAYQRQIMQQFLGSDKPELFIVVDDLLDSFDAPVNAVLYLARQLSGHTMLQAVARVARVNRTSKAKPFGRIIDYTGTLEQLDQPLTNYPALAGFSQSDLEGNLLSIYIQITQLPSLHANCWSLFQIVSHDDDTERYERELAHPALRAEFQTRLTRYCKVLNLALDNAQFMQQCNEAVRQHYLQDASRLLTLKINVQLRYGESGHVSADESILWRRMHHAPLVIPKINLLEPPQFLKTLHDHGLHSPAAQADTIACQLQRYLTEMDDENYYFYRDLRKQLEQVMSEVQARCIDETNYLQQVRGIYAQFLQPAIDLPPDLISPDQVLNTDGLMLRLMNLIMPRLNTQAENAQRAQWANTGAQVFVHCVEQTRPTPYKDYSDQMKQIANQIDDYLCDVMEKEGQVVLSDDEKDHLIAQVLELAHERLSHAHFGGSGGR